MKEIPLTQGKVAIVDDEDYEFLCQFTWRATEHKNTFYAITTLRDRTVVYMHRIICPTAPRIDHRDGNGLHNQRENLRPATVAENARNKKKRRDSKSIYKGVSYRRDRNHWVATIFYEGNHIYLGSSSREDYAAKLYDQKARELFGEFARLNFPEEALLES